MENNKVFSSVIIACTIYTIAEYSNYFSPIVAALFKTLPAFSCIYHVIRLKKTSYAAKKYKTKSPGDYCNPVLIGLLFCAGGDFSLRLEDAGNEVQHIAIPYFLLGLLSFLIGHFFFIAAYISDGGNGLQFKWGVVCYLWAGGMVWICTQNIPSHDIILKLGVTIYGLTIATMTHRSISLYYDSYPGILSARIAMYGAIVFVVSDSILAFNRFVAPVPFAQFLVLSTYFAALALITASCAGKERWAIGKD
jgi:uncharacterized membrane protein YhhN